MLTKKKSRPRKSRSSFRFREATLKDLPILVSQRREMWKGIGISSVSRALTRAKRDLDEADSVYSQWVRSRMKNKTLVAWLAQERGKVVGGGCVWLQPIQPMPGYNRMLQPYLLSMYTEPSSRRHGVASAIVDHAISWARKNGFPQLRLHAAEMGRGAYSKQGFKRTWEMMLRLS